VHYPASVFAVFERKKCDGRFRPAKSALEIERIDIIVIDGDEEFVDSLCVCALPQLPFISASGIRGTVLLRNS
jgi:hypothetical protein